MLIDYLDDCYDYYMSNHSKFLVGLNLSYYRELRQILWDEHIYPNLCRCETKYYERDMDYRNKFDEGVYYKTIVKNDIMIKGRSIQIYLDVNDKLHQSEVDRNGWIWGSVCRRARREYSLKCLLYGGD